MDALTLGARFRKVENTNPVIPFSANNVVSVELPRSFLMRTQYLRLTGSLNVTVGLTLIGTEQPLPLIKKIEFVADGRKQLFAIDGKCAFRLAHVLRGKQAELVAPPVGVGATQAFAATIVLDHQAIRMAMPVDSFFDPRLYEKIEIRITWGTTTDIFSAGTATVNAGCQIEVQTSQTTVGADQILFNKLLTFDEVAATVTSSNLTVNIPRAGLLSGILFRTELNNATADNIINNISIVSDNSFRHMDRLTWATLQRRNVIEFQMDGAAVNGNQIPGYAWVDFTEDGLISSAVNTLDLNVLQAVLDVTGAAGQLIRMNYLFYEPIRIAA